MASQVLSHFAPTHFKAPSPWLSAFEPRRSSLGPSYFSCSRQPQGLCTCSTCFHLCLSFYPLPAQPLTHCRYSESNCGIHGWMNKPKSLWTLQTLKCLDRLLGGPKCANTTYLICSYSPRSNWNHLYFLGGWAEWRYSELPPGCNINYFQR